MIIWFVTERSPRSPGLVLALLAFLCVLAYAPSLSLRLIEDDYPMITEGQAYGSPAGLPVLLHNTVFRVRATSYWITCALWHAFHLNPFAFHLASLALHIVNTWLVYWLALAWPRMRAAALWAAIFFAVQEGHQEAVMWYTAINELLVFAFGIGALVCWLHRRRAVQLAGIPLFALAVLSKETAVVLPALLLLLIPMSEWRRSLPRLLPYLVLAVLTVAALAAARTSSFRFTDGSFSLHAPFWITWPRGMARILWFWGILSLAVLLIKPATRASIWLPLAWMGIALTPYSFLTYSTQIPSRQTYLASVGLVFLFGLAVEQLPRKRLAVAVLLVLVIHNCGYLWTRKRRQFVERAAPTEQLIRLAKTTNRPIWVRCFPRVNYIAEEAVHVAASRPPSDVIWTAAEAARRQPVAEFCYQAGGETRPQ